MTQQKLLHLDSQDQKLKVGLSWDANNAPDYIALSEIEPHDVDLSCALLSSDYSAIDVISPQDPLREKYKSIIHHSGDHMSGASYFEDEDIQIWLSKLDVAVEAVVFFVSIKGDLELRDISEARCDFMDGITLEVLSECYLSDVAPATDIDVDQDWSYVTGVVSRLKDDKAKWALNSLSFYVHAVSDNPNSLTLKLRELLP